MQGCSLAVVHNDGIGCGAAELGRQPAGMDDEVLRRARENGGCLPTAALGQHPGRVAARQNLVVVQPRVLIAGTQPVAAWEQVVAVRTSIRGPYAFLGRTALWLYDVLEAPDVVEVGVPASTGFAGRKPLRVRRLAAAVLHGSRTVQGCSVVSFEVALIQASEREPAGAVLELIGEALRSRRTAVPRLRGRCIRGLAGSAAVRAAIDQLVGTSLDGAVRRLRVALAARGVDGLRTEVRFSSDAGASAYVDLLDEAGATAVEVDGFLSHTERARFRADRRRDRWMLQEHQVLTVRVDAAETVDDLERVADELAALILARRGAATARAKGRTA